MKRLLPLAFLFAIVACSGQVTPAGTSDAGPDSTVDAANACVAAGGQCIALSPSSSCPAGTRAHGSVSCGGVGASCCLPDDAGADAAPIDGGRTICLGDAGWPVGPGTCGGAAACGAGCACSVGSDGSPHCQCTGALLPDAGPMCTTVNCGGLFCGEGCRCLDDARGTCWCF